MNNVLASADEAKPGALSINWNKSVIPRNIIQYIGHRQPATLVQTENSSAKGIVNRTAKQRRSKEIYMRYYWIQYQPEQGQLKKYWSKGATYRAYYFTKEHNTYHHQSIRPMYLKNIIETRLPKEKYTPLHVKPHYSIQWYYKGVLFQTNVCKFYVTYYILSLEYKYVMQKTIQAPKYIYLCT